MELNHEFRVGVPVSKAWKVLTDVEHIAPMLPGAQLQEVEGDDYRGIVKVKVGPITAQYKGTATIVEQDEKAGKVVLRASGRDTRGQGNANAVITATMTPDGDAATQVSVLTDLTVTGKVAQFGRGVMADVSAKLMGQFVDALEADLAAGGSNSAPAASAPEATATPEVAAAPVATASPQAATESGPRRVDSPEAQPVDLLQAAGAPVAKRLLPVAGGLLLVLLLVLWLRRRGT